MRSTRLDLAASVAAGCVIAMLAAQPAQAQTYKVLHRFTGGADGAYPYYGGVIQGAKGNLYGTTPAGGRTGCNIAGQDGCGVVFKLDTASKETVLYSFYGAGDGANPYAGVIQDTQGNLYGTTYLGGAYGVGTVFKLSKTGKESVLYSFKGGADGGLPTAGVIRDAKGNLYGTTINGGAYNAGTVFKLSKTGKLTVLHTFTFGADGGYPDSGVIQDAEGNLYGTAAYGGVGYGVVFKLSQTGKETVLYSFAGGADGAGPTGVMQDANGNFYGTTGSGGDPSCNRGHGCGVVFKLSKTGKETVLYSFKGGADGADPLAGVIRDTKGNLYGTTYSGGGAYGGGTLFKRSKAGKLTVLHSFTDVAGGLSPLAGVIRDTKGNLFGTTSQGGDPSCQMAGSGCGVVFKLTP